MGPGWIRGNEEMANHMHILISEVKLAPKSDVEEALKRIQPDVFEEGPGRCTKEEVTLQLIPSVRPVFCRSRPEPHAAVEKAISSILKECIRNSPLSHEHVRMWEWKMAGSHFGSGTILNRREILSSTPTKCHVMI
ncbi:unnamed protein product [Haemonchus placei]|uniref:Stress-response A/B barrel domain-containing protein n=1 Tax=Haemonchus placei TaxID=6290 RepID=A0A0N4X1N7_HAEPC|nr:unnamed protein product [Haemonchus placei]